MFRRAAVLVASSALALTATASPAIASQSQHDNKLNLTVCKKVIGEDHGKRFHITVSTDKAEYTAKLKGGQCEAVTLAFVVNKVHVSEKFRSGYTLHRFNVPMGARWDTTGYKVHDNKAVIRFVDCDGAKVKVVVVNKKDRNNCGCR